MVKNHLSLLIALLLGLTLNSCSGDEDNTEEPTHRITNSPLRKKKDTSSTKSIVQHDTIRIETEPTFHSERMVQIEEILLYMYNIRIAQLEKAGVSASMLGVDYKSIYDVKTAPLSLLKQLDYIVGQRNMKIAQSLEIDYDALMADSIDVIKIH